MTRWASPSTDVLMKVSWHLKTPGIPCVPPFPFTHPVGYVKPQLESSIFLQSQVLICSAASVSNFTISLNAWPKAPMLFMNLVVYVVTKPLNSATLFCLSCYVCVLQPFVLSCVAYCSLHGMISSLLYRDFYEFDHKIRSSLRVVVMIFGGKVSFWSGLICIFQSLAAPRRVASPLVEVFAGHFPAFTK